MEKTDIIRCKWAQLDPLMIDYHDKEWGVAQHNDIKLFEFLILEGAQAGLSWSTVLRKRENYSKAFEYFNPEKVANFTENDITRIINTGGIIKNLLKIKSAITNAKMFQKIKQEYGTFDKYIWEFTNYQPQINSFQSSSEIPASTDISKKMSTSLKKRGFTFVGPTICYAFMQAVGIVNDHLTECFRYQEINELK